MNQQKEEETEAVLLLILEKALLEIVETIVETIV